MASDLLERSTGAMTPVLNGELIRSVDIPSTRSQSLAFQATSARVRTKWGAEDAVFEQERALLRDLDARTERLVKSAPHSLLAELSNSGLSWRDIAAVVGVTVPAIQKWRRGAGISGAVLRSLAQAVGLLEALTAHSIEDPASWLEVPIKQNVSLTRLDLLKRGRADLVLRSAANAAFEPVEVLLDAFDTHWRKSFVDENFEVFEEPDGVLAIRPRTRN